MFAWDGSVAPDFAGGQGTSADPYQIATAEQLAFLARQVNEQHFTYRGRFFVLTEDIDLFGTIGQDTVQWTPIGIVGQNVTFKGEDMSPNHHPFQGTLDGQNHTVRNLYIHNDTLSCGALFGHISLATIRNIRLENVQVFATSSAAALCAQSSYGSVIENCHVMSGKITVRESWAGGIAAYIRNYCWEAWSNYNYDQHYTNYYSVIRNCSNNADILSLCHSGGGTHLGGIAGIAGSWGTEENETMHIIGCKNTGSITGRLGFGGICGYFSEQTAAPVIIDSCANYGHLHRKGPINWSKDTYIFGVGGIVGATTTKGSILHCLNAGDILNDTIFDEYQSGRDFPPTTHGGIVGYIPSGQVKGCVNIGYSDGKMPFGGICGHAGRASSAYIDNCLNAGSAVGQCGGIAYKLGKYAYVRNCVTAFYDCVKTSPGNYAIAPIAYTIVSSSSPPPSNLAAIRIKNSYFDIQTNSYDYVTYGPLTKDYGQRFTHQMIGDSLRDKLQDADWVYADGMYPRPKGTEDCDIAVLAATPIFLNYTSEEDYDNLNNLHASFKLSEVEGVTWSACEQLRIVGNTAYIIDELPADSAYVLYAHYGTATRKYIFRPKEMAVFEPIDNIPSDTSKPIKIMRDGQIYILRDKQLWTLTGQTAASL